MVHPHRERVDQRLAGLRRSHGDDRGFRAVAILQFDRERDGPQIEGADYGRPVALDGLGFSIEVGVFDERNLLDANGDFQHESLLCG